jgi:uncharacterized membrane protein YjjP (DUF1212 family)
MNDEIKNNVTESMSGGGTEVSSLRKETRSLKKSLKKSQDELEAWRSKYHKLDKKKVVLDYRLSTSFFPELLKFLTSGIGIGFAFFFYANGQLQIALFTFFASIAVYAIVLYFY